MKIEITSMSTKGQVVIPSEIRETLKLAHGTNLAVFTDGKRILLKPLKEIEAKEFRKLVRASNAALKKAKKRGSR